MVTESDMMILLKTYLGDIDIEEELVGEIFGFMSNCYDEGYQDGFHDGGED